MEHHRASFYRRYWPREALDPENFTVTINTASVDQATMVEMLTALIRNVTARKN